MLLASELRSLASRNGGKNVCAYVPQSGRLLADVDDDLHQLERRTLVKLVASLGFDIENKFGHRCVVVGSRLCPIGRAPRGILKLPPCATSLFAAIADWDLQDSTGENRCCRVLVSVAARLASASCCRVELLSHHPVWWSSRRGRFNPTLNSPRRCHVGNLKHPVLTTETRKTPRQASNALFASKSTLIATLGAFSYRFEIGGIQSWLTGGPSRGVRFMPSAAVQALGRGNDS